LLVSSEQKPKFIVGDLKQVMWGFVLKKIKPLEWLSVRRLLKGPGLAELVRKQLSSISAGIWPCSLTKFK